MLLCKGLDGQNKKGYYVKGWMDKIYVEKIIV